MTKNISVLGSTGSIGTQALDVAELMGYNVKALTANSNVGLLEQQARKFNPELVVMGTEQKARELKLALADTNVRVSYGMDGLCEAAVLKSADTVLNSVVGMVGLKPTLEAISAKKNIALANKETLVAGGSLVMRAAKENGVNIYPVDSEHSAIFQCLQGSPCKKAVKRLILTASGGPFFGRSSESLKDVTVEQALNHPNWSMGAKITIDSASMMNKGLEIIEAKWLFDVPVEMIDVVVHRESIVHSMIEYVDNSVIAQMGVPDMKIPIQYALTYPERVPSDVKQLDLTKLCTLSFYEPDYDTFKCLRACKRAIALGGTAPAAANGANEEAVKMFLDGKISFLDIGELVWSAMENDDSKVVSSLADVLEADKKARAFVKESVKCM
ncbi:MAG: 1-deoxy-D-xylulose-5-phosphate reductoisomerase [Lachnospiraceae bacterium]|nr:1-deoxy-D-xylulose-5-phosphate reductoisomerase [Lachnospiraceae bacterium]